MMKKQAAQQGSTSSTITAQIVADLESKVKAMNGQLSQLHAEQKGFEAQVKELMEEASKLRLRLTDKAREIENRKSDLASLRAQLAAAHKAEQTRLEEERARLEAERERAANRAGIVATALGVKAIDLAVEGAKADAAITELTQLCEAALDVAKPFMEAAIKKAESERDAIEAQRLEAEKMAAMLDAKKDILPQAERMLARLNGETVSEETDFVVEIIDDDEEESVVDASVFSNAVSATTEAAAALELGDLLAVPPSRRAESKGVQKAVQPQPIARPAARPAPAAKITAAPTPSSRNNGDKADKRPTAEQAHAVRREIARLALTPLPKPLQLKGTASLQPVPRRMQTTNYPQNTQPQPKGVTVREISVGGELMRVVSADVTGLDTNAPLFRPPHNADVAIAGHRSKKNPDTEWVIGIHPRRDVARLIVATIKAKLEPVQKGKSLVVKLMESNGSLYLNIQVGKSGDRPLEPLDVVEALADGSAFAWIGEPPKRQPSSTPAAPILENGEAHGPAGIIASSTELAIPN